MANLLNFVGYSKASGRNGFMRIFVATFSGNAGALNTEVLDFTKAGNPNGLEDPQIPSFAGSFAPPMILDSTTGGNKPELQIGGNGTTGQTGISFYSASATPITSGAYSAAGFPANGTVGGVAQYGRVTLGVMSSE